MNVVRAVVATAAALVLAACGGGGALDDLARSAAKSSEYSVPEMRTTLESADQLVPLTDDLAGELEESTAFGKLMKASDQASAIACDVLGSPWADAYKPGPDEVFNYKIESDSIVREFNAEAASATAADAACTIKEVASGGE